MKIVVIGGTGLIGSKLVAKLTEHGHEAIAASPNTGVNTLTGEGLAEVMQGASVVVDVSNSPSFADDAVMDFFKTSTSNLLAAEAAAGVGHHVALSVVGTERLSESGYFRAKIAQEKLIKESSIPYSIVHATQFFEFLKGIAQAATDGEHGPPGARADPADGGGGRREGGRPHRRGLAAQRHRRGRRAGAVPSRRADPDGAARSGHSARRGCRSPGALLRRPPGRADPGPVGRRHAGRDAHRRRG